MLFPSSPGTAAMADNLKSTLLGGLSGLARIAASATGGVRDYIGIVRARRNGTPPPVMPLLYLDVIKRCNLRCAHCGFPTGYPARGRALDTREALDIIEDASRLGTRVVSFGGGEPLMREDIFDLIARVEDLGMAAHMDTNGTLLDPVTAAGMSRFERLAVTVSLDHPDPGANDAIRGKGVFMKVAGALDRLHRQAPDVRTSINCVIVPANIGRLSDMVGLGARWGLDAVRFTPAHGNLNHSKMPGGLSPEFRLGPEHSDALKDSVESVIRRARVLGIATNSPVFLRHIPGFVSGDHAMPCFAGYAYGNVDPYGFLFPCYDHGEPLNVRKEGLFKAWTDPRMERMRSLVRSCENQCWNTGNAEPSIRMDLRAVMRHPGLLLDDIKFYL